MVTVTIRIPAVEDKPEFVYSREATILEIPVERPKIEIPEIPKIPELPALPKTVKIETLKQAFMGQEVPIMVTVFCGAKPSTGEWAALYIGATKVDEQKTSGGRVVFRWVAEPGTHKIIVDVPPSDFCPQSGRSSTEIDVSSEVPEIYEKLAREREAYKLEREKILEQRRKIREMEVAAPIVSPLPEERAIVRIPIFSAPTGTKVIIGDRTISAPVESPVDVEVEPGEYTIIVQPPEGMGEPIEIPVRIPRSPIPQPIKIPPIKIPELPSIPR